MKVGRRKVWNWTKWNWKVSSENSEVEQCGAKKCKAESSEDQSYCKAERWSKLRNTSLKLESALLISKKEKVNAWMCKWNSKKFKLKVDSKTCAV